MFDFVVNIDKGVVYMFSMEMHRGIKRVRDKTYSLGREPIMFGSSMNNISVGITHIPQGILWISKLIDNIRMEILPCV